MEYSVKVKHRRFLNGQEAKSLQYFGVKIVLNNGVYDEHSSHMISKVDLSDEMFEKLFNTFNCTKEDNLIVIDMGK